jgi:zinc transport system permease protein
MRTVGLLLVSALMVVPVATSQQLSGSFRTTLLGAMLVGTVASIGGLVISAFASFKANVAPGPTIVILALAFFAIAWPIGAWLRHRERLHAPFDVIDDDLECGAEDPQGSNQHAHLHQHGPDCGHPAIEHGDHVDYLHHGHRHAAHVTESGEPHYDEH